MHLSQLLIDVGDNPDRPRPGRMWLRNIYHVHQRLSMAFPTREQRESDPDFLKPFSPDSFERPKFLFRVDHAIAGSTPRAVILVQSELPPDWDYAFHNARMFLAAPPETKEYQPTFEAGAQLRFRICINLSKKQKTSRNGTDLRTYKEEMDAKGRPKTQSKRVAFHWDREADAQEAVREWFDTKASRCGFTVDDFTLVRLGWVRGSKKSRSAEADIKMDAKSLTFRSALLQGRLTVVHPDEFSRALREGVGARKAFGFGLLTVARG